jgi:hypothetical protein
MNALAPTGGVGGLLPALSAVRRKVLNALR